MRRSRRHKFWRYAFLYFQRELLRNAYATYLKLLPVSCLRIVLWMSLYGANRASLHTIYFRHLCLGVNYEV